VLDFSRTVPLDTSELLDRKTLQQLTPLMEELATPWRALREIDPKVSVIQISDYIALRPTRRALWETFVKEIGALMAWADEVRPYAVRDLRKKP
jgi:hypothetical protein